MARGDWRSGSTSVRIGKAVLQDDGVTGSVEVGGATERIEFCVFNAEGCTSTEDERELGIGHVDNNGTRSHEVHVSVKDEWVNGGKRIVGVVTSRSAVRISAQRPAAAADAGLHRGGLAQLYGVRSTESTVAITMPWSFSLFFYCINFRPHTVVPLL